jgi:ubiquinone/menaquinone biosynthesis C-methylase UbiE
MSFTESQRYQRCQAIFDRAYPNFRHAAARYLERVAAVTNNQTRLLDVGCGRMSFASEAIRLVDLSIGVDLAHRDLVQNQVMQYVAVANAEHLPFPHDYFDVIISQWAVEHFARPGRAFREMGRVLRPGGHLILLTTNANNYVPLFSKLVPDSVQNLLIGQVLQRPAHESFPTFFRANTRRALHRLAQETGFTLESIDYAANPFYLAFNVPLFRLALLFEKITDWKPLHGLKLYLLATLRKNSAGRPRDSAR